MPSVRPARFAPVLLALFLTGSAVAHASTAPAPAYRGPIGRPPVDPLPALGNEVRVAPPAVGVPSVCGPRDEARTPYRERATCAFVGVSCPHERGDGDWTAWWRANADPFLNLRAQLHAEFDVARGPCGFSLWRSR